ncbi:MAG: RuBisCO large subunit C-terminal-like domain-containing protein [Chloroflexota bacterium]|nr:RuBisCO large subunit C-terminal-like domain-containing protein [Chloroflexota bacterium]
MIFPETSLSLSGERFGVCYRLVAETQAKARAKAYGICLEQTVEIPDSLLADDDIRAHLVGRIEALEAAGEERYDATISYPIEAAAGELTQLLNVVFGNSAMHPGIKVLHLDLPESLLMQFHGPRFGREGIRSLLGVTDRALLCTALKPMGLGASDLADLAYKLALGGIDIIKEDHGLTGQSFAPFSERVPRCAEAVQRANRETGYCCLYVPNVTAPADQIVARAFKARGSGAGGIMVAPGLVGWDSVRILAQNSALGLPILSHPAWLGTFAIHPDQGLSHRVVFGQLPRLAGADATIFVNFGGRFSFSRADCRGIVEATAADMGPLKPIFPIPAGGMTLDRLPELSRFYGKEAIFLIAGALYGQGPDLVASSRQFRRLVEQA